MRLLGMTRLFAGERWGEMGRDGERWGLWVKMRYDMEIKEFREYKEFSAKTSNTKLYKLSKFPNHAQGYTNF